MPLTPCLTCGRLADGTYCGTHRPSRTGRPRAWSGWEANRWRERVLIHTNGRCAIENCATPDDGVQAHHVFPVAEYGKLAGPGIALCRSHHHAIHHQNAKVTYTHGLGGTTGRIAA